jgi:hypothetical protein
MKRERGRATGLRIGIAIGRTALYACRLDAGGRHATAGSWTCPPPADGAGAGAGAWGRAVAEALAALGSDLGAGAAGGAGRPGTLHITLLPSLAQTRRLELPRMRDDELHRVLRRDAGRYFFAVHEPQVVGTRGIGRGWRSPRPLLAAAAPAALVEAVLAAAQETGWRVASVATAHAAWAEAARDLWPRACRGLLSVVVAAEGGALMLELDGGRIERVRQLASDGDGEDLVAGLPGPPEPETGGAARPIAVLAPPAIFDAIAAELSRRGWAPVGSTGPSPTGTAATSACGTGPEALAARYAARAAGPELLPDRFHARRRRAAGRITVGLGALAVLQVAVAAALHLWGIHRELDAVAAARLAIRAQVAQVAEVRTLLADVEDQLAALGAAERTAVPWTLVIADVAAVVPADAYLTSLRVRGDTLRVDGSAVSAGGALAGLRTSAWLSGVHADGPFQQVIREGLPPEERFSVQGRVLPHPLAQPAALR